jgi:hypothetical protein
MKIALFVEGPSDKETISILLRKILGDNISIIPKVFRGRGSLLDEREVSARIIYTLHQHSDISKIIVCVDSECTPAEETKAKVETVANLVRSKIPTEYPLHYIPVIHALEGWLLSDRDTVKKCLGHRAKIDIPVSAFSECRPKEVMKDVFKKANKDFLPLRDCPTIADQIDIKKLELNESFAYFQEKVKDP